MNAKTNNPRGRGRPATGRKIQVSIGLDPDLRARLAAYAEAEGVPISLAARRICAPALDAALPR